MKPSLHNTKLTNFKLCYQNRLRVCLVYFSFLFDPVFIPSVAAVYKKALTIFQTEGR